MFHVPHHYRLRKGLMPSTDAVGNNGAFRIALGTKYASVIASDGEGWEHVSVSFPDRCPTWDEMCKVKALFWDDEDCVIQYHPPQSAHINNHPYCLHMWRPVAAAIPMPPGWMVGNPRDVTTRKRIAR